MTDPATPPVAPEPPAAPPVGAASTTSPPWGSDENFNPAKAWELIQNLRKEKADPELAERVAALQREQEEGRQRLAAALGLTEPPKSEDDLAETVKGLQAKIDAAELKAARLAIAAEHSIPAEFQDLLTETDMEKLRAQAEKVGALVAAKSAAAAPPAFQSNPGQGQAGGAGDALAAIDAQIAEAVKSGNTVASIGLKQQRAALISNSK